MIKRNRISLALVLCLVLSLVIGSFAFFTDRAEISGSATTGELAVGIEVSDDISTQLLQANGVGGVVINNWNPGDNVNFSYTVENDANKALRAQETITLKVTSTDGRVIEAATVDAAKLTIKGEDGAVLTTAVPTSVAPVTGGYELTYIMPEFTLSGTGTNAEEVAGSEDTTKTVTYSLDFDKSALNNYQGAEISILVHVDAIQALNTATDVAANEVYAYATIDQETIITDEAGLAA